MGHMFLVGDAQLDSPFFQKLPLELRRQIYYELFGSRHLHIGFSASTTCSEWNRPFHRQGHPKKALPCLWHCICRHDGIVPHRHSENNHKWYYISINLLFTCKTAYEEGIAILYGTNKFIFDRDGDWKMFTMQSAPYIRLLRSLDFNICNVDGPDSDASFAMMSICQGLRSVRSNPEVRFVITNRQRHQLMDFKSILTPLARLRMVDGRAWGGPAVNIKAEIFLKKSAQKFIKGPFELAVNELRLGRWVSPKFWKNIVKQQPSPEDTDDENYGVRHFDDWVPPRLANSPPSHNLWGVPEEEIVFWHPPSGQQWGSGSDGEIDGSEDEQLDDGW